MVFNAKEVKKHLGSKNFYLYLLEYVKKYNKLPSERETGLSKQLLNYYVKPLKIDEIIIKKGYGVWVVDEDKKDRIEFLINVKRSKKTLRDGNNKEIEKILKTTKEIRGHGFCFTVEIPKNIDGFLLQKEVKKHLPYENIKNNKIVTTKIKGNKVWFCSKSIVIWYNEGESIFGESAKDCMKLAIYEMKAILKHIERNLRVSLNNRGKYVFNISKSHYGKVNDELAKTINESKEKLSLYSDKDGKQWCLIDNSFNLHEIETVHTDTSQIDMDNVVKPLLNGSKKFYEDNKVSFTPQLMMNLLGDITNANAKAQTQIQEIATGLNAVVKIININNNNNNTPDETNNPRKPYYVG